MNAKLTLSDTLQKAITLHQNGQLDRAIDFYNEFLSLQPQAKEVHNSLGCIYQEQGRYESALACFEKALAIDANYVDALINRGNSLQNLGQAQKALPSYKKALQLFPESVPGFVNLGNAHRELGNNEWALACYQKAAALSPNSAACSFNIAATLVALGKANEAKTHCQRALDLDPTNPMIESLMQALSGHHESYDHDYRGIESLFNKSAAQFDKRLKGLDYVAPKILFEAMLPFVNKAKADIIDLGCGTGLSGQAFLPLAKSIVGIDLSARMLEQAKNKQIYTSLMKGEISLILNKQKPEQFDMAICTDVLIYASDITPIFQATERVLKREGLMGLTIETSQEKDKELQLSGRWAQSVAYIKRTALKSSFSVVKEQPFPLRKEGGREITGHLFVLQKKVL